MTPKIGERYFGVAWKENHGVVMIVQVVSFEGSAQVQIEFVVSHYPHYCKGCLCWIPLSDLFSYRWKLLSNQNSSNLEGA